MFLKQLTNNIDYNTKLENKLLSQTVYNKLFVRSNLLSNKNLKVIDNNTNFYLIKTVKNTLTFLNGNSCLFKILLLKHKLDSHFNFEYLVNFNFFKNSISEEKNLFFKFFKNKKVIFFLLLYPVKGGYICFSLGIKAFLPLSHLRTILINKFKIKKDFFFSQELLLNKINFLCVNKKFNFFKSNLLFKLSGQLSKKFILSFLKHDNLFKQRKFNSFKSKKKSISLRYSNFIFLKKTQKNFLTKNKTNLIGIKPFSKNSKLNKLKKIFKVITLFYFKYLKKNKYLFFLKFNKILNIIAVSKFNSVFKNILKIYIINLLKKNL